MQPFLKIALVLAPATPTEDSYIICKKKVTTVEVVVRKP